ncbi:MAG: heavy-metal-associated domain-containing protein [Candidatus Zixiibacteriota bacterium]
MKKQLLTAMTVVLTVLFVFSGSVFAGSCSGGATKSASACTGTKASVDAMKTAATTTDGSTVVLTVSKMTCGSCVKHVTQTLTAIDGVQKVDVSLEKGTATVAYDKTKKVDESMLVAALVKAGYPTKLANATTADAKTDKAGCDPAACADKKGCDPAACAAKPGCDPAACTGKK